MGFVRRCCCGGSLLLVALAYGQPALASSFSQAQVVISRPVPDPQIAASTLGSDVVSVSNSGVTLSAQSDVATGSVGLQVQLPAGGYDNSLTASATWADDWTGATSLNPTVPVGAVISLDGSIDTALYDAWLGGTIWNSYFSLLFRYEVGDHTFQVGMGADHEAPIIGARFDGTDITASLIFTPDAVDPTRTHFALSYASPVFGVDTAGFFDALTLTYQSDGQPPAVDAIHTFRTQLGSPDPTVSFSTDSGRTFGLPTAPEPSAPQLEEIALAGIVAAGTRSMRRARG